MHRLLYYTLLLAFLSFSCTEAENNQSESDEQFETYSEAQMNFWDSLQEHCGNAYAGSLSDATDYYLPFDDSRLILHVFDCTNELTHLALQIGDNRSRNLLLTKTDTTLRLKHDHRYEDGSKEEITMYGGDAPHPGLDNRQIFLADAHTAEIYPDRFDNFWFLDIENDSTLSYGVHWPMHGNSIRLSFDTSNPVETPPSPWGYN